MDTDKVRERVRELDGVVVAVGLTLLMFGSVMITSGAVGVMESQETHESAEKLSCDVKGLSPVGTASAQQATSDDARIYYGTESPKGVFSLYASNSSVAWSFTPDAKADTMPIVHNSSMFIGTDNGTVYSLDAQSGALEWKYSSAGNIVNGLSVANGSLYFGDARPGDLIKLDAETGVKELTIGSSQSLGGASPAFNNGVVYASDTDGRVHGYDQQTGDKTFSWNFGNSGSDAAGLNVVDGFLYASVWDPQTSTDKAALGAYNLSNGTQAWSTNSSYEIEGRPTIVDHPDRGVVAYVAGDTSPAELAAFDGKDGSLLWEKNYSQLNSTSASKAVAYYDGKIFWAGGATKAGAVNATTGKLAWRKDIPSVGDEFLPTAGDGVVYYPEGGGDIVAVDPDNGSVLHRGGGNNGLPYGLPTYASSGERSDGTRITQSVWGEFGPGVPCEGLWVDTREFVEHNLTVDATVYAYDDVDGWTDVTNSSSITVDNTTALTYSNGQLTSTKDKSVNTIVEVRADYGRFYGSADVTVATETVNNTDILPPMQSATAVMDDDNGLVVVLATAISAAVAFFASSLAGVAAFPVIIVGAWVAGYVSTAVLLASMLMSIFIGLNVAQVVEYSG
jgi:outer membrane protein assembly factor BamB